MTPFPSSVEFGHPVPPGSPVSGGLRFPPQRPPNAHSTRIFRNLPVTKPRSRRVTGPSLISRLWRTSGSPWRRCVAPRMRFHGLPDLRGRLESRQYHGDGIGSYSCNVGGRRFLTIYHYPDQSVYGQVLSQKDVPVPRGSCLGCAAPNQAPWRANQCHAGDPVLVRIIRFAHMPHLLVGRRPLPGTKRYSTPGHCRGSTFSWSGRYCITTATIDQLGNCRILSVNGVGYSKLDRPARSRAGMVVSNNPEYALEDMADAARAMRLGL